LIAQKEEDKRAALEQLSRLKDEESSAVQLGWEKKVQALMAEVVFCSACTQSCNILLLPDSRVEAEPGL
jgi:hypothetical protein